jgi:hypothetical protein
MSKKSALMKAQAYKAIVGFDAEKAAKIFAGLGYTWGSRSPGAKDIREKLFILADGIEEGTQSTTTGRLVIEFDEFGYAIVYMKVLEVGSYEN